MVGLVVVVVGLVVVVVGLVVGLDQSLITIGVVVIKIFEHDAILTASRSKNFDRV